MRDNEPRAVALVTGGQGGIGQAINRRLVEAGYTVVSGDVTVDRARSGRRDGSMDGEVLLQRLDVTSAESVREAVAAAAALGPLRALVNCAGILRSGETDRFEEDRIEEMFDINLFGAVRVTVAAAAHMTEGSAIVNVSSISCRLNDQGDLALYGATKAALESFTRANAHQLGPRRIRVNAVAPGVIDVAMSEDMRRVAFSEKSPLKRCPLGRMGTAEEVAECVEFLLSRRASYVNGTTLMVDGGISGY
jgi:3-oxoacyl-[acyl-carrier protein] reductase